MKRKIIILGMPVCLGAPLSGCSHGPDVIRKQLIASGIDFEDKGNLSETKKCKSKKCAVEISQIHKKASKELKKLKIFNNKATNHPSLPILIGGDHSMNFTFIEASANQIKKTKKEIGLIWFDAHGDFNTPQTTITGNIHGMVLSALTGRGLYPNLKTDSTKQVIKEENICLFGVRDLDPKEEELLKTTKVKVITAKQIKIIGIEKALKEATKVLPANLHLSFDLDVFDPRTAPGTNTPVNKGFSQKHLTQILKFFKNQKTKKIVSADIMEFNPLRDKQSKTAEIAVKIITGLTE